MGDGAQGFVPRLVAIGIVEVLEMIDVTDDQADGSAVSLRALKLLGQYAIELSPIIQAGQAVGPRQMLQSVFLFANSLRHQVEGIGHTSQFTGNLDLDLMVAVADGNTRGTGRQLIHAADKRTIDYHDSQNCAND